MIEPVDEEMMAHIEEVIEKMDDGSGTLIKVHRQMDDALGQLELAFEAALSLRTSGGAHVALGAALALHSNATRLIEALTSRKPGEE